MRVRRASEAVIADLCDGLTGLSPEDADTLILAGMGGETIAGILEAAPWARSGSQTGTNSRRELIYPGCPL